MRYVCIYVFHWPSMIKICWYVNIYVSVTTGSNPAPFCGNILLDHKKADWVKAQRKLVTTNVQKIINSFRFINDLLSLNYDSTFEKDCKDIYSTELKLKKENNINSRASFLDI